MEKITESDLKNEIVDMREEFRVRGEPASLTARAAHFNLPLVGTVAAILAVNLGFAVRATPGNVGVFQAMYALTAAGFGMDKDQAIAVAFLALFFISRGLVSSLPRF